MSTSLSQQLQRLAAPQTIALIDSRHRASILFDSKEAATKDRRTIYDLGLNGLQELEAINPNFQQFEATLFEESTLNFERSVEHSDVNRLLDLNIHKFLHHLSPYFLLRPAHMCIEWLLRRFHIHEFNRSALIALALPYHETNTFVRVLQVLRLRKTDKEWGWLKQLQKRGLPLAKSAVIKHASKEVDFLNFICRSTQEAVRELGAYAHLLQAQLNFYASVVVGVLQSNNFVSEKFIMIILPSLFHGFNSNVVDYLSAVYIITSQLVTRVQLTPKLCNAIVKHVAAVSQERLRSAAILLLTMVFDTQTVGRPDFTEASLLGLIRQKWLTPLLASFTKENVDIYPLCAPLLTDSIKSIYNHSPEVAVYKQFLEQLLNDVQFSPSTAQKIINCVLDAFLGPDASKSSFTDNSNDNDEDIIELDSDEDMPDASKSFQSWYANYLHTLEHQYPNPFDLTIKDALKANTEETNNRNKALKIAIGHRLKAYGHDATDIYESLYHHTAQVRLYAIQTLMSKLKNKKSRAQNFRMLHDCLADRIYDDSELVVRAILELNTKDFVDILGHEKLAEALFCILYKAQQDKTQWASLIPQVLQHLTSTEMAQNYDNNLILLQVMPLLFPSDSSQAASKNVKYILESAFAKKVAFLKELEITDVDFSATAFKKQFLKVVSDSKLTPTIFQLLESVQRQEQEFFKTGTNLANFLLLITACCKNKLNGPECMKIFQQVSRYVQPFQIKYLEHLQWKQVKKQRIIPLQLFSDFIITLVQHTHFDNLLLWEQHNALARNISADLQCFLNIITLLARKAFIQDLTQEVLEWRRLLKDVFDIVFVTAQTKLDFLSNFYLYAQMNDVENYTILRVHGFLILNALLKNTKNEVNLTMAHILKFTVGLTSPSITLRLQTLETLQVATHRLRSHLRIFVDEILARSNEIEMDQEQYPLVLYTILQPTQKQPKQKQFERLQLQSDINKFFSHPQQPLESAIFTLELLKTLKHVNNEHLTSQLIPLGLAVLERTVVDGAVRTLPSPFSHIYELIVERLDNQTIGKLLLDVEQAWGLFVKTFDNHHVYLNFENKLQPLPCFMLKALSGPAYQRMPQKYQNELIKLILKTVAVAEHDAIFLVANKMLKKSHIDCAPFVEILVGMCPKVPPLNLINRKSASKRESTTSPCQVNKANWKEGVALLELLEGKRKLRNAEKLVPALFELLKHCLQAEEQAAVEYTKQLALSALLNTCQKSQNAGIDLANSLPKSSFRIDQIVQCLRTTQNPQTHNNALMLLSHCAALFPHQVLHNIVDIFTFMGSSVVRHDDAFSFHIINSIIESIIPILVHEKNDIKTESNPSVIPVLKVFSDIMLDVPEHRRLPLYNKLLQTLDAEKYLWSFLCVVFEAHVTEDEKQRLLHKKSGAPNSNNSNDKLPKRMEIALELTNTFEPKIVLETCIKLLHYINTLPLNKMEQEQQTARGGRQQPASADATEMCLFDVKCHTAKQLRHYKYLIMQFLSTVSNAPMFHRKIALLSDKARMALKPYYQNFIIQTLSFVPIVNTAIEQSADPVQTKFWKVISHHVHDVLDNAISLLSPEMFLLVVTGLMQHQTPSIRKKVIELLINKLQNKSDFFDNCNEQKFHDLLQPLTDIVDSILQKSDSAATPPSSTTNISSHGPANELIYIQQNALIALKLLSKLFALQYIDDFKNLLSNLTKIAKKRANVSKILLATVILTTIEISSNLKAHSLAYLPKYMPQIIEVLQDQAELVRQQPPDHVCIALVAGIQKLVESLPLFLGPYVVDIITSLSSISSRIQAQNVGKDQRSANVLSRISTIWTKMAKEVPVRVLVPSCEKSYKRLLNAKYYNDIAVLMQLLHESIAHAENTELSTVQTELTQFFLEALGLRLQLKGSSLELTLVNSIEAAIVEAFVSWVLKLSESSFRPVYNRVYEWALKQTAQKETMLTYFLLTNKIAEALKSLFVLFAGNFIDDAAQLLNECHVAKQTIAPEEEHLHVELLLALLSTMYNVFLYDSKNFVNAQRFEVLMTPIVEQLENRLVLESESLQQTLTNTIAQLAVAVSSDMLWKQLNYQVLLKTRTGVPEVRIISFNCCVAIARKLGEDFTPLLPETVPFIAELFEDENPRVEKSTRKAVQELEGILGESLQKYL